jgi:O-antigen ligase
VGFTLVLIGGAVGVSLIDSYESLIAALGRDPSLTGRVPLWKAIIPMALEKPVLGYGYGAFWLGSAGPSVWVWTAIGWRAVHGHNGYLDLWLDLGIVGLALGTLLLGQVVVRNFRHVMGAWTGADPVFWASFGLFIALYNFAESTFLKPNSLYWVLLVYSYLISKDTEVLRGLRARA